MNDGGGDGAGCFDIKEWADTTELTNVEVAACRTWKVQLSSNSNGRVDSKMLCRNTSLVEMTRGTPSRKVASYSKQNRNLKLR